MRRFVAVLAAGAIMMVSCGIAAGNDFNKCEDSIPAPCGDVAHCVLANDQYLQGQFPSSQIFVVHVDTPQQVTFSFQFNDRISAGTTLMLTSSEPDCGSQQSYTSNGDLFQLAGPSGVLSFPIIMMEPGDHLVQFSSDSYCSYQLVWQ